MLSDITEAVTGILTAIGTLLSTAASGSSGTAVAYVLLFALPVTGGVVALGKRLVKKAR